MLKTLFFAFLFALVVWVVTLSAEWSGGGRVRAHYYYGGYYCEPRTNELYHAHYHPYYQQSREVGHYLHKHVVGTCG